MVKWEECQHTEPPGRTIIIIKFAAEAYPSIMAGQEKRDGMIKNRLKSKSQYGMLKIDFKKDFSI